MSRGYELHIGKGSPQVPTEASLPLRVKVQIDLVNQNNRFLRQRILALWKGLEQAPGKIHCPGKHRLVTEAETRKRCLSGRSVY